jgi:RNA polymerase II subunit A C-terminal domain phosphatase SSU72
MKRSSQEEAQLGKRRKDGNEQRDEEAEAEVEQEEGGGDGGEDEDEDDGGHELRFAVVCSSNMNRSMEAHKQFMENGLDVTSFGVGNMVRLPSPGKEPLSFEFDQSYASMKAEILERGEVQWYRDRGLLDMLDRNIDIKDHPDRFQDFEDVSVFDIVFCFEERVFDILVKDLKSREPREYKGIHVLNLDVKDDAKEAKQGAAIALDLCKLAIDKGDDLEGSLSAMIKQVEEKYGRPIIHMTHFL